jgi:hypothetical protein
MFHLANFLLVVGFSGLVIGVVFAYFGNENNQNRGNSSVSKNVIRRAVESRPATNVPRTSTRDVSAASSAAPATSRGGFFSAESATVEEPLHSDTPEVKAAMTYATELVDTDTQKVVSLLRRWLREDGEWHER